MRPEQCGQLPVPSLSLRTWCKCEEEPRDPSVPPCPQASPSSWKELTDQQRQLKSLLKIHFVNVCVCLCVCVCVSVCVCVLICTGEGGAQETNKGHWIP